MDRRNFLRNTAIGVTSLSTLTAGCHESQRAPVGPSQAEGEDRKPVPYKMKEGPVLFATDANGRDWVQFKAEGFTQPVCGIVYRRKDEVPHGMPLGGVSTGFLDIETNGTLGFCTLFNSGVPTRGPLDLPFLGLSVDGKTCVLTTRTVMGNENAQEIHYWGHYPVVDVEYETSAPVSVGMRAWSPFVPGDVSASNIPAAVFEVHVRNVSKNSRKVTLALSFPGPTQAEAQISPTSSRKKGYIDWVPVSDAIADGSIRSLRKEVSISGFQGISVTSEKGTGYALGVIGEKSHYDLAVVLGDQVMNLRVGKNGPKSVTRCNPSLKLILAPQWR